MPVFEWSLAIAIILLTGLFGLMSALLIGIVGGCVIFAVNFSRIDIVRHHYGLDERASALVCSADERDILARKGGAVRVIEPSGFIFFGSADQLLSRVRAIIGEHKPRMIILDFARVLGIPRTASVRADAEATVWLLSHGAFHELKASQPPVAIALTEYLVRVQSERLVLASRQIDGLQRQCPDREIRDGKTLPLSLLGA